MAEQALRMRRWHKALTGAVVSLLLANAVALSALETALDAGSTGIGSALPEGGLPLPPVPDTTAPTAAPPTTAAPSAKSGASRRATTTTTSSTLPSSGGVFRYEVTVSPLCVVTGAPLTVTLRLRPNLQGVLIAGYADGDAHMTRHAAIAGPDGLITHTAPAAPVPGPAKLLTQAADEERRTGWTSVEFRVVRPGEPC